MRYCSLLTHMELGRSNDNICRLSGALAKRMNAAAIGIAAARLVRPYSEVPIDDLLGIERAAVIKDIEAAERTFRSALQGKAKHVEWRSNCGYQPLADYIAAQSRSADLIITGPDIGSTLLDTARRTNIGGLVLTAGRPVLIVPPDKHDLPLENVVIAWKDTREARRAAADALPLLKLAKQVTVVEAVAQGEVDAARERVEDVALWLDRHGIMADAVAEASDEPDLSCLRRFVRERNCDLLVAGAYGHSRLQEWVFSGVTMDLLLPAKRCVLLSH